MLTMKILRADLVSDSWVNCLDCNYQSLDPLSSDCIFVDGALQPLWHCYLVKSKLKIVSEKKVRC